MKEKEFKYMRKIIKCKEVEIPNRKDDYGRNLMFRIARQSDAEQITNEETGVKTWSAGAFFDMFINAYITDDEYDNADDESLISLYNKLKL